MKKQLLILSACLPCIVFAQAGDVALIQAGRPHSATQPTSTEAAGYELVSFVAEPMGDEGIGLSWRTAAEVPNSLFTVERSADRMNWRTAFTMDAEGGTKGYTAYKAMDLNPLPGISYYRLVASKDGRQLEVSDDFAIEFTAVPSLQFKNERDPGSFSVVGKGAISNLQVLNNRGQFIPMDLHYEGGQVLVNALGLEPGTYFVQALVDGNPVLRPVIVTTSGVIGG